MSVSLTLVPVALALRVVMGKDKFNSWVESNQVPVTMNFKSRKELTTTLHEAGFDALPYGSSLKTHYEGKNFFFWELREGKWTAVFTSYDRKQAITHFIKKLEQTAARKLTFSAEMETEEVVEHEQATSHTFPTNFTDLKLLEETLQHENIPYDTLPDGSLRSQLGPTSLHFVQYRDGGVIDVQLENEHTLATVFQHMSILDESYRQQIQQNTYNQLVENAEQQGFFIEDEMKLPDESILITLRVGDDG